MLELVEAAGLPRITSLQMSPWKQHGHWAGITVAGIVPVERDEVNTKGGE